MIECGWLSFKEFITLRGVSIQWVEIDNNYHLRGIDGAFHLGCFIPKDGNANQVDFETNFKATGNRTLEPLDIDGTPILRNKIAKSGAAYRLVPFEVVTGTYNGIWAQDYATNNRPEFTHKIYDIDNIEITSSNNQALAVKTVIDFEPAYNYEIVGGMIHQQIRPTSDIRVFVVIVPDIPAAYGGSKEMIGGVNLKFIDPTSHINADGRASKPLSYSATNHTNKVRIIIKYDAGVQHQLMSVFEYFY